MVVLRLVAAVVAVAAVAALTSDLLEKRSPGAAGTPAPDASPSGERERPERRRPRPRLAGSHDPTVYDAQALLDRCARSRRPFGAASRGPGLDDDIRRIAARVERLRRLDFARPVDARLVPREEVGRRFSAGYLRRYTEREAARDEQVLAALRLVPEGTDLRSLVARLLDQGVAGFYNPRADRLYAGSTGGALSAYDEVVLAHELDHALVDQVLRLPGTLSRDPMLADVVLAHQALAEGDATLLMSRYAAGRFDRSELDSFMSRFTPRPVRPTGVPYFVARSSEFPYYEGLLFACGEWRRRGWSGLDRMYLRPPASSADVLFPLRYRDEAEARLPRPPSSPGASWEPARARSFGAFDVMVLLENADLLRDGATVPGSHVDDVRGWDGGVLHSWLRGDDTLVHIGLVDAGVATRDGRRRRLCRALRRWLLDTFPDARSARAQVPRARAWRTGRDLAVLRCAGARVQLAKGPSAEAVRAVVRG